MRVAIIFLLFTLLVKPSSAQNDLVRCVQTNFTHMDTLINQGKNPWTEWKNCVTGKHIPAFSATTLTGQKIDASDLKDKVVVINFWSISCPPCLAELPALNKLVNEYKNKNVVFIAITFESMKRMNDDFFPRFQFDFKLVINAQSIIDTFGSSGYPTTYIVDKKGMIKDAWIGGTIDDKQPDYVYLKAKPIIDGLLKN